LLDALGSPIRGSAKKILFLFLTALHNPAGMKRIVPCVERGFAYRQLIFIFGALADKDYKKMLKTIAPLASHIILTQIQTSGLFRFMF
jgi:folylpolyglutamate synthase/dihydropteroate synthase